MRTTSLRTQLFLSIAAAPIAAVIPLLLGPWSYGQYMVEMVMVYLLAATGLNIAIGFAGQFQMAQGAIMAVAAYGSAILAQELGWPLLPAIAGGIALALVLAAIVALLSARLVSHYLLLASFGLQVIVIDLIPEIPLTGGHYGRNAIARFDLPGLSLIGATPAYSALLVAIGVLGMAISYWLKRSYLGIGLQAVRQSERMVNASGVSANRQKFLAVLISGAYAAVAGILVGPVQTFLVPTSFGIELTLLLLIMVIFGGAGSIIGVLISAVVLSIASQIAQSATTAWPLIYGLFVMALLTLTQKGIGGSLELLLRLARGSGEPTTSAKSTALAAASLPPAAARRAGAAARAADKDRQGLALSAEHVSRSFGGVVALSDVSLGVPPGALHGLVGPNGSGKTTFFEIVSGFVRLDSGTVRAFGREIGGLTPATRCRFGMARSFQHPTVLRDSLVIENVLLGVLHRVPPALRWRTTNEATPREWLDRAAAALDLVGLRPMQFDRASSLSYGQRKLLDLARVVASSPSLALLDEPLAGIGESSLYVRKVIDFLKKNGCAILLVEHNMQFVMETCDRVNVLNTGRIIASGGREEVLNDPEVLACYLGPGIAARNSGGLGPFRNVAG
jgi:branched-chain amino acid transport system permease protein